MLEWLEFSNLKALADVRVELSRFTVLVGPNACGKTTVLQGAQVLGRVWRTGRDARDFAREFLSRTTQEADWRSDPGVANIEVWAADSERLAQLTLTPTSVLLKQVKRTGSTEADFSFDKDGAASYRDERFLPDWLSSSFVRVYPELAAAPAYSDEVEPTLGFGGQNLPLVLANYAADRPETLFRIRDDLRAVVPQVRDLKMPRRRVRTALERPAQITREGYESPSQEVREVMGHGLQLVLDDGRVIEASDASEGTLRTLAILTAIHSTPAATHRLALIDDLDQALHPSAQIELVQVLRRLLELIPELQIITTTHSPYLLDAFDEDEVRVLNRTKEGATSCRPLAEHPEWPKWKGKLQLGEFWSSTGEDWVLEAPATKTAS